MSRPTYWPTLSAAWSSVCPSPMVTTISGGANGSSSRNRQTPEKFERVVPVGPLGLELAQAARDGQAVPVVDDVEQVAAGGAGEVTSRPRRTSPGTPG